MVCLSGFKKDVLSSVPTGIKQAMGVERVVVFGLQRDYPLIFLQKIESYCLQCKFILYEAASMPNYCTHHRDDSGHYFFQCAGFDDVRALP